MMAVTGSRAWLDRWGLTAFGCLVFVVGVIMMPAPGPGFLVVAGGVAIIIAGQFPEARSWFALWGLEVLGWLLVPLGIIMMPAPGPGTLVLVGGIALLSRRHRWARRIRDPLERNAIRAAKFGVATWPRIGLSVLGCIWLLALGAIWWASPDIPEFNVLGVGFGPKLPAAGWGTAIGIWASAVAAFGLLIFSIVKWRKPRPRVA